MPADAVAPGAANPYVFVVGCPRSGTTLLRRILDAHRQLAIPKVETHWIPKLAKQAKFVADDGRVRSGLREALEQDHRFARLGLADGFLEQLLAAQPGLAYPDLVSAIFDAYAASRGKVLAGDKTPGYARCITELHALFPDARFIHLIRDGRDVALSLLAWDRLEKTVGRLETFQEDPVSTVALFWEWMTRLAREAGADLPAGQYTEVHYESLVTDTEGESRRLCEFLGLAWDSGMPGYFVGRQRSGPGISAKKAWLPPTGGLRDWRAQMPSADQRRFEAAAGALLADLGYHCAHPGVDRAAADHAAALRSRFSRRPLPRAWA